MIKTLNQHFENEKKKPFRSGAELMVNGCHSYRAIFGTFINK